MRVIDISGHQANINLARVPFDGVVIKATEGQGWVSPTFVAQTQAARTLGKKVGFYHFVSTGNTPASEAANFLKHIVEPIEADDAVVLDWEQSWNNDVPSWCAEWWDRVANVLQRAPFMYLNLSTASRNGWGWALPNRAKLWLAQYPTADTINGWDITDADKAQYNHGRDALTHGDAPLWDIVMWQYTNKGRLTGYDGNLDLSTGSIWEDIQPNTST